jgi:hypothetical protein
VFKLPPALDEISGIAFNRGRPDTVYAEQDEEGRIFYFSPGDTRIAHQKFGRKGDYEDIALCNGTALLLRSDGVLFSFALGQMPGADVTGVQESRDILPGGEYEGMWADEQAGQVYVLCKNCAPDDAADSISGYILQLGADHRLSLQSEFHVGTKHILPGKKEKKSRFRPSALAKSPLGKEWFILSSVNKLLVVTDENWVVKASYPLDPTLFNQPEGIAFDQDNNLYISNERGESETATVLKFAYKK